MSGATAVHTRRALVLLLVLLGCLVLAGGAVAGGIFSGNFGVPWDARYGGGEPMSSDNYAVSGTVGQAAIGRTVSTGYVVAAGYWYGLSTSHQVYLPLVLRGS
jgi:hypothetical protein